MKVPQPKQQKVNIHILSPIHIGTGEELDPFSFVIRNEALVLIDLIEWMERFPEKGRLDAVMAAGDFVVVRSFIADNFNDRKAVRGAVPVLSRTLLSDYEQAVHKKDFKKRVLVDPITRSTVSGQPYIPGSSLKGSIRTAIANRFVRTAGVTKRDDKHNAYNKKIFGAIWDDPMRWLKISDIALEGASTAIFEAKEFSSNPTKPLTPKNHVEAFAGFTQIGRHVTKPARVQLAPFKLHQQSIDSEFIIDALNAFYIPKYIKEYKKFYQTARFEEIRKCGDLLNAVVKSLAPYEALVRIGHFSHAECVTLDGVRNPQTRKGRDGRKLPWGTTRTLANGIYPFGWAILEFKELEGRPKQQNSWAALLDDLPVANQLPQMPVDLEKQVDQALENMQAATAPDVIESEVALEQPTVEVQPAVSEKNQAEDLVKAPAEGATEAEPSKERDKLLAELELIDSNDMGRIGTIIQKIDALDSDMERAEIALAIKRKISKKAFKKHKRKSYLIGLIEKGSE